MENCLFCKIVRNELPRVILSEDEKHMAIMDLYPNTKGVTVVITKNHFDSDATDMPERDFSDLMLFVKKTAKILEKGLDVQRVSLVMEGLGINHVHVKLYPLHGLTEKFVQMWHPDKIFFDKYEGYITTQIGPEVTMEERQKIVAEIRSKI